MSNDLFRNRRDQGWQAATIRVKEVPWPGKSSPSDPARPKATVGEAGAIIPSRFGYLFWKRVADVVFSLVLFTLLGPVLCVAALLVKLSSHGPAFYRQTRLGKNGRLFTLLKLRTMVDNAEAQTGPVWSIGDDPRITSLGRLLRKTHIDEFPQLLNVLRGHMSLVGPRPERPEIVATLESQIPFYRERLKVHPGITGLAQLRLLPDAGLDCVRRKLVHDLYYVQCVSPWLDFRLLIVTAWVLLAELSHSAWSCLTLPSHQAVEHGFRQIVGTLNNDASAAPLPLTDMATVARESGMELASSD
jgi:lipopolysaccharide/colanic/teichoic acid biosynthesis glycosyltransferase